LTRGEVTRDTRTAYKLTEDYRTYRTAQGAS
jgi:hypothetical protein